MENELNPSATVALFRQATDIAGVCKKIVLAASCTISGKKYVNVEGWTAIAVAHGCIATVKQDSVQEVYREGKLIGIRAIAEVRRQSDGALLSSAEGFVGADETTWFGGVVELRDGSKKTYEKRADYAIRAMAQTRAVSRVCRTSFSHVVVLMKANLETTPAEEADAAFEVETDKNLSKRDRLDKTSAPHADLESKPISKEQFIGGKWKEVIVHFGENYKGKKLGELTKPQLKGWLSWHPKPFGDKGISENDQILRTALDVAAVETAE